MRDEGAPIADRAAAIVPPIVCEHPDDVSDVWALDGRNLFVRFVDGTAGHVDLSRLIQSPDAGVFAALNDNSRFRQVGVELGAVTWPGGIDLAPDAMYAALREHGVWVL